MKPILPILFLLAMVTSCTPVATGPEPEVINHSYKAVTEAILNPERGFFTPYELPGPVGFSAIRATGNTLVHVNIRLDDWRETDLPQDLLDSLDQNFADMRDTGVKAIIRFAYNQGPWPESEPDASKAQILRHIEQLTPLLQKNGDVIAWAEAGFIGAWGEWHTSTNGLDNLEDKRDILNALLQALPQNRMAQVRYPTNILQMYPDPMDAVKARVAHHNDCFLSSATDVGTYEREGENTIIRDQTYLAELTRYTPMSGETCAPNPPRSECETALQEMALLHFSAINEAYHKGILRRWEEGGCLAEVENRLGYRLALVEAQFNEQVRPGGLLNLSVKLENTGFAAPVNPRPLYVVLTAAAGGVEPTLVKLDLDPRQWQPGTSAFTAKLRLPSNLAEGSYRLALWLPDEAATLAGNPLYAVRFANENTWDEATGYNLLGEVRVDQAAGGSAENHDALVIVEQSSSPAAPVELPIATLAPVTEPAAEPTPAPTAASSSADPITGLEISGSGETLTIQFNYAGNAEDYNGFQVFLDTDQDPGTGYAIGGLGANFLLENGILFSFAGSGTDWNWTPLEQAPVTYENSSQAARWEVRLADLGSPSRLSIAAQLVDTGWNTVFTTPKTDYSME